MDITIVSIITAVLNGIKYLEACIQSVLNQSYPYLEHVFIDGGSTDGTVEMLAGYHAKYPEKIRFICEPDKGIADAWNKGWKMAKGDIFGWLGADDMCEPGAILTVVEFFRANPDAYFVYGACNYINKKSEIIAISGTKDFNLKEMINEGCCLPTPSAFYKRELIEKIGWLDLRGIDFDYWIRTGKVFQIHRIERVLADFRIHEGSGSTGSSKEARRDCLERDCCVSRRHGGGIFSGYCRRYYRFLITEWLRPILGFTYPFIKKLLKIKRR